MLAMYPRIRSLICIQGVKADALLAFEKERSEALVGQEWPD